MFDDHSKTSFALPQGFDPALAMPEEPERLDERGLDAILLWASNIGASDIDLMSNDGVFVSIHGRRVRLTKRRYGSVELEQATNIFYGGANGVSHIRSAGDIDSSYQIRNEKEGISFQYRVNVTACRAGIHCTIRTIVGTPPSFNQLNIEKEIVSAMSPENGLVFICGKTNSGKSTFIAASLRQKLEDKSNTRKILCFEAPIEYVFDQIDRSADMIVQHEIPKHLKSFSHAVRNSMRRASSDIVVGECRDYETISAAVEAAETGHALFTTIHANSVSESFYRILNMFPQNERSSKIFEIIDVTRLIVAQKLVTGLDGKRVALREYLVFTPAIRERLRHVQSLREAVSVVANLVREKGKPMAVSAFEAFSENRISKEVLAGIEDLDRNIVDDFDGEPDF